MTPSRRVGEHDVAAARHALRRHLQAPLLVVPSVPAPRGVDVAPRLHVPLKIHEVPVVGPVGARLRVARRPLDVGVDPLHEHVLPRDGARFDERVEHLGGGGQNGTFRRSPKRLRAPVDGRERDRHGGRVLANCTALQRSFQRPPAVSRRVATPQVPEEAVAVAHRLVRDGLLADPAVARDRRRSEADRGLRVAHETRAERLAEPKKEHDVGKNESRGAAGDDDFAAGAVSRRGPKVEGDVLRRRAADDPTQTLGVDGVAQQRVPPLFVDVRPEHHRRVVRRFS
mmetsp:Transcript_12938/g.44158  ORF Transcript_12938/g.44158 Transcript_12938/m.44158 type:complete len:284 (+) Transcript_12938:3966-4817(+)